jgi:hypothetical protein
MNMALDALGDEVKYLCELLGNWHRCCALITWQLCMT